MGWNWSDDAKAFYMSGKATNWMGSLSTKPIDFPANDGVTCSFDYMASGAPVELSTYIDDGYKVDTVVTTLGENSQDFKPAFFSFQAVRTVKSQLCGQTQRRVEQLRNVCFQ